MGRSGLIIIMLILQLLALCITFTSAGSLVFVQILLLLSLTITGFLIKKNRRFAQSLALLADNAERIKQRQKLVSQNKDPEFAAVGQKLLSISENISEFQRREHSVINHALDVICSIDQDHKFQSVNPASTKVWGYSPQELIGTVFTDLIYEEDKKKSLDSLFGAEKSVDTLQFENRLRRKDGSILHVLWSAHWSAADQALFCVAHDITSRKLAEKMLEESERRIRQIIEDLPVGMLLVNKLGIIEMSNPALCAICNCSADELKGKHIQTVLSDLIKTAAPPDFATLFVSLTDTVVSRKSGGVIPVHVSARELILGGDKKYLLVLVDSTEREKLDQLKREFFAMVSHDLRSPLTSLSSVLDALETGALGELNPKGKEVITRNSREVGRLIKLVDELLDIEKMKSGKFAIEAEYSSVDAIMEPAISALEHFAQRREIQIQYTKSGLHVYADSSLLIRVLVNLLSNAVKFSPPRSSIDISVSEQDSELVFSVKDRGRGIPAEFKQRIFEPFEQVESADGKVKGGTGLGLPICKMIVEQHGGRIWVESETDRGSCFLFAVPRKTPEL